MKIQSFFLIAVAALTILQVYLIVTVRKTNKRNRIRGAIRTRPRPYRLADEEHTGGDYLCEEGLKDMVADKIIDYFERHKPYLNPKLKLKDLEAALHTNRNYLSQAFNETLENNFNRICNHFRVREACRLYLKNPRLRIKDLAVLSGFNSHSSFLGAFRIHTNYTPGRWQKEVKDRLAKKEPVTVDDYVKKLNFK